MAGRGASEDLADIARQSQVGEENFGHKIGHVTLDLGTTINPVFDFWLSRL